MRRLLYLDKVQNIPALSRTGMRHERRKCRIALLVTNRHLERLDEQTLRALPRNDKTLTTFCVGVRDADAVLPEFSIADPSSLPNHHTYLRPIIAGLLSRAFREMMLTWASHGKHPDTCGSKHRRPYCEGSRLHPDSLCASHHSI